MRIIRDLSFEEAGRRLRRAHLAVLAFTWDDEIHVMPVNVGVDRNAVWFRAVAGVKLDAATAGIRMAVHIHDSDVVEHGGWSVTARGAAVVDPDGPTTGLLPQVRPWIEPARGGAWVRIPIDRLDGRELASSTDHG